MQANRAGFLARSALDPALFTPNFSTIGPIVSVAWVRHGLTVQVTAAVTEGVRTRGEAVAPDPLVTGAGGGVHVGYFFVSWLSAGAELRYVASLSTTAQIRRDGGEREQASFAVGPRFHVSVGPSSIHPGISYAPASTPPMTAADYDVVGVDVPVTF